MVLVFFPVPLFTSFSPSHIEILQDESFILAFCSWNAWSLSSPTVCLWAMYVWKGPFQKKSTDRRLGGGVSYAGPTTCVTGYYCAYSNEWYSQCVPGTGKNATMLSVLVSVSYPLLGSSSTTTTTTSVGGTTTTTSSGASTSTTSISGYAKVVTGKGVFEINGKETYFMGTNCYWCGFLTDDADVDLVMTHIAEVYYNGSFESIELGI
jgi:hypothetical protein